MPKNLYVGNLPYSVNDDRLRELFERFGQVHTAKVITDRYTGQSRGFGFVEMDPGDADAAIDALNNSPMEGRPLKVNEAKPKEPRLDRGPNQGDRRPPRRDLTA